MQDTETILANMDAMDALVKKGDTAPGVILQLHKGDMDETKPTPDNEPFTPSDAAVVAMFNTLGVRQRASIIRQALTKQPRDRVKAITIKEAANRMKRAEHLYSLKRVAMVVALVALVVMIVVVLGVFLWVVFRKGTMSDTTVIGGLFSTMANVLKIIWSAPTGG